MGIESIRRMAAFWKNPTFSPRGFVAWALLISITFLMAHAMGLSETTCVLCGTSPSGSLSDHRSILLGLLYVMLYFGFILVTPILLIAAGIFVALKKSLRSGSKQQTGSL